MRNPHGSFIWYELIAADPAAAAAFYSGVTGWTVAAMPIAESQMPYTVLSAGASGVAGLMAPPLPGMRTGWSGYIGVDDVDASVAAIEAAGGAVLMPAVDMPGVGRMAHVADPQGVPFHVIRGEPDEQSGAFDPMRPGHCAWNELATPDLPAALNFYTRCFGWTKGDVMPMGDMGDYQFIDHGDVTLGAMMTRREPGPPAAWNFYFRVADVDAAATRATAAGATIHHGPAEVPGGDHIVIASDPQGTMFSLVGARAGG